MMQIGSRSWSEPLFASHNSCAQARAQQANGHLSTPTRFGGATRAQRRPDHTVAIGNAAPAVDSAHGIEVGAAAVDEDRTQHRREDVTLRGNRCAEHDGPAGQGARCHLLISAVMMTIDACTCALSRACYGLIESEQAMMSAVRTVIMRPKSWTVTGL